MQIVYSQEQAPTHFSKSIFLVGPTPRSPETPSWRPQMLQELEAAGYDGVVFVPEPRDGSWNKNYFHQIEWEIQCLEMSDLILAWVPRDLSTMPAFTTNVEFGRYVSSQKLIYGRPDTAAKIGYLDWTYKEQTKLEPYNTLQDMAEATVSRLSNATVRTDGERNIPLHIWKTPMFQNWYGEMKAAGNRLDDAKVLWTFTIPKINFLFSYILWVKVWIESENRFKENEFIFSRSDISCILPYWLDTKSNQLLNTKVVLIKEFRSPVRNSDGFVHELPGGSSFKGHTDPLKIASEELEEETGLKIDSSRFQQIQARQLASTLSTHKAILFTISLTDQEIQEAEAIAQKGDSFGVEEDTERTFVEVKTLREIMEDDKVDWSMIGMMLNGIAKNETPQKL